MSDGSAPTLRGRRSECEHLEGLLHAARDGSSQVLVLRGESGIGKSALLRHTSECAEGWRVAEVAGVESELELAYSGLHQLCLPMLDHLDALPTPQRDALRTVFGMSSGHRPDRFLVGLATLTLLAAVAEAQPLLCIVDDAQWLDEESQQVLYFVVRRLLAERVAAVFAVRTGPGDEALAGLPELSLGGLDDTEARSLLLTSFPGPVDSVVLERVVVESQGNPLALLELTKASAAELAGGYGPPTDAATASALDRTYRQRILGLPPATQLLLLVAAAEPTGDVTLLWRAATILGVGSDAAAPAERAGLVRFGLGVWFHHPVVRSTVYRTASADERRRAHAALAEAVDPSHDPDRRAWHRAHAILGTDEEVAAELEASADRAQARGGVAASAAFLSRAVALTPDPARRSTRALAAAEAKQQAGAVGDAAALLAVASAGPLEELQDARADLLRGRLAFASPRGREAPPLLLAAAQRLGALDATLALDTYLEALAAGLYVGRLGGQASLAEIASAAREWSGSAASPPDVLLRGLATTIAEGYTAGAPLLHQAVTAFRSEPLTPEQTIRWSFLAVHAAHDVWDEESWAALADQHVRLARRLGALAVLPIALSARIGHHLFAGEISVAASLAEEVDAVAKATGNPLPPYAALAVAAFRGRESEAAPLIESALNEVRIRGDGMGLTLVQHAQAVLYNSLGRYEDAFRVASQATGHPEELAFANWSLVQLVEAASRCGDLARAARACDDLLAVTRTCGTQWALGVEACSRALVSDGDDAEAAYREAIDRLGQTGLPLQLARAQLLYGEWLRRQHRRIEARENLRDAHTAFDAMGTEAYAQRARRELQATGEKVRARTPGSEMALTPQELQIARLVVSGRTNNEIGAELFLSPRTVEWHLRKVFEKLGIKSRYKLRGALLG